MRIPSRSVRWLIPVVLVLAVGTASRAGAGTLAPVLRAAAEQRPDDVFTVWVFFEDRGIGPAKDGAALKALESVWCRRSLQRRAKVRTGPLLDERDLPPSKQGVERLVELGIEIRARSRWFNAVSARVRGGDLPAIGALPEVRAVIPVARYNRPRWEVTKAGEDASQDPAYGFGFDQVDLIQVPALHTEHGLSGQGVRVALLDSRFDRDHEALRHLKVFAEWDFVDGDPNAAYEPGDPTDNRAGHGTMTLSVIGGYRWGQLIGPAYGADYVLARTELSSSETPVEEEYWVQGIEWAESLGVDIVSSSLGYLDWYSPGDLNGETPLTTRAADRAAANGVLVVNSAGNEGAGDGIHGTLIAPADGDSVLTVGAVYSNGVRASFSSVGPTADGRIKPDVMAQGVSDYVASPIGPDRYETANGTSFSAPLVAGLAALLLEAHPDWTPWDVITALRSTATRAHAPDNYYGWGICRGLEALAWTGAPASILAASEVRLVSANPFRPGDRIALEGTAAGDPTVLQIFDCLGRLVFATEILPGAGGVRWDATDRVGGAVAPGVYFVKCARSGAGPAHKIVLVR